MSTPVLFIDRDGTLVEEPPDHQVDALSKIRFMPGVFAALAELKRRGIPAGVDFQPGRPGTASFPRQGLRAIPQLHSGGIRVAGHRVRAGIHLPAFAGRRCECRKPKTGLVRDFMRDGDIDLANSAVIGDRETDLELARNLGIRGLRVLQNGTDAETWGAVVAALTARTAVVERRTKETQINVRVGLDATSPIQVSTGIGFFDHMLEQLAKHGGFALELTCKGDLQIDEHHTVEDCALALGEALRRALGNKVGIARYGFLLPMDEAEAKVAIDLSGRAYAVFEGRFGREQVGGLPTELVPHFFHSLAETLGAAVHVSVTGENTHHMIEASFKGVGRALRQAFRRESDELPTTKGVL